MIQEDRNVAREMRFFVEDAPKPHKAILCHIDRVRAQGADLENVGAEALILGGGYGRGEGGVLRGEDGRSYLFNDFDYFLFCQDPAAPTVREWITRFEQEESPELGLDVEVKALRREDLRDPSRGMMFYDLVAAHHVIWGPDDYLAEFQRGLDPARIEVSEISRLLWNRGSGLYFARMDLTKPPWKEGRRESVIRNHQKCKLALGDALLGARREYHHSVLERARRLEKLSDPLLSEEIAWWHREGVEFKLRPVIPDRSPENLRDENYRLVESWLALYLQIEARRLDHQFQNAQEYALFPGKLFPETPTLRNIALAMRDRLKRGGYLRPAQDYPRGALMRALVCLLRSAPLGAGPGPGPAKFLNAGGLRPAGGFRPDDPSCWLHLYQRWWAYYS